MRGKENNVDALLLKLLICLKRERKVFNSLAYSLNGHNYRTWPGQDQDPGVPSGSPGCVQGPQHSGHLQLLCQASSKEPDKKWSSPDLYGMPAL